jgi:mycothiol synthase
MARLVVCSQLTPEVRPGIMQLIARSQDRTGHRPLPDQLWLDLMHGGRPGFTAIVALDANATVDPDATPDPDVLAYCQISQGADGWTVALTLERPDDLVELGTALLQRAGEVIASRGGGSMHWWVYDPLPEADSVAKAIGLRHGRSLYQMRVHLPLAGPEPDLPLRSFEVERDEAAWLEVNNAAFAGHAEQGGWDLAALRQRELEDWFDPEGFLLHERDSRLAAFCWTKIHHETTPVMGEIYVVAVHPDFHGLGLGRALTRAGLASIAARGITTGMLFVDQHNTAAVELYRSLGFTVHRTDHAYTGHIEAA